jgi:hypothetical protein
MAKNRFEKIASEDVKLVANECLRISFEYLDWDTEEFFFHGLKVEYYQKVFDCLSEIKRCKEKDIVEQTHPSLKQKSIFNKNGTKNSFPDSVIKKISDNLFVQSRDRESSDSEAIDLTSKRAFEVRVARTYGRLHGFIWNNTFHVVWFDPAHNLYPIKKYGVRKHEDFAKVRCFSPDEIVRLRDELKQCQEKFDELYDTWANEKE